MPEILDPFVGDGYSLASLTAAINVLPNNYGRLNELDIAPFEGITTRTVIVERVNGVLNLLPSKPVGAPGTTGIVEKGKLINFNVPHIPHDDVVLPEEVQGVRAFGAASQAETVANLLARKLQNARNKHGITLEYLRWGMIKGIILDADGSTLVDLYTAFGISAKTVDFVLGTAGTLVQAKCREVLRHIEKNLQGEVMQYVRCMVSPEFFDKLIGHAEVKVAYQYYASGQQPLREDTRRSFPFAGIMFEEHVGEATTLDAAGASATRRFIASGEGHAFPVGTMDTFKTYGAPADFNETVNTIGLPVYAKQEPRKFGRGWDVHSQSNPLPLCKRPEVLVKVHSSN